MNLHNEITINTFNYTFEIKYLKVKLGTEYFTIFNGNANSNCFIKIKKDNEIQIQDLDFFEICTRNKSLLKNENIVMLLSILQYVNNFYNKELNYIFQDNSSINILGHKLKLNLIYVLLYGKTWTMKNLNAFSNSSEFNVNLQIINKHLDGNKDNLYKFFRKSLEFNSEINIQNNNIEEYIILQEFIDLVFKNGESITKGQVWKNIKKIYKYSINSRDFLQLLYKKYGFAIFTILNYYEYYQYVSMKLLKVLSFECYMQIPNDFINSINVIV